MKLSMDSASRLDNHSRAEPVRFSANNLQWPTSSLVVSYALVIANMKDLTCAFGSLFPAYSGNLIFPVSLSLACVILDVGCRAFVAA